MFFEENILLIGFAKVHFAEINSIHIWEGIKSELSFHKTPLLGLVFNSVQLQIISLRLLCIGGSLCWERKRNKMRPELKYFAV